MPPSQEQTPTLPLIVRFGAFVMDEREGRVLRAGQELVLARRPFALLCCLLRHANQLLSREALLDTVWGHRHVSAGVLKTTVHALREALGNDGRSDTCRIESVPRRGYRLMAQVTVVDDQALPPLMPDHHASSTGGGSAEVVARPTVPAVRLIGRQSELAHLARLSEEHRLITVTGPGGVGKTSLVRQWLALSAAIGDGVGWCDLAAVTEPSLLPAELARAWRLALGSGEPTAALANALRPLTMVAVLDNAEHLVDAAAQLVQTLLAEAPGLTMVVTSQVPLRLADEQVLLLGPLSVPPEGLALDATQALGYDAVGLFVRRAVGFDPRFRWGVNVVGPVVDIVRSLDGLPLALEMAAARLPMFGPVALAAALPRRLQVLTRATRNAPARQHTLRAALEWSHGLLTEEQQVVFRRLSVLMGTFTLETAQRITVDDGLDEWQVLAALNELVDRALLAAEHEPRRFRWLESPRALAIERLAQAGETAAWRARHAHVVAERFDTMAAAAYAGDCRIDDALAALRPELADAREAIGWALVHEPATAVLLMAPFNFAAQRDAQAERRRLWLATAPHVTPALAETTRARWSLGACRFWGHHPEAERHGAEAAALCRRLGDQAGLHRALWAQLSVHDTGTHLRTGAQPTALLAEIEAIPRAALPAFARFQGHYFDGARRQRRGDFHGAIVAYRQALAFAEEAGDSVGAIDVRIGLAELELAAGSVRASIDLGRELVASLNGSRHRFQLSYVWLNLAAAWLVAGDPAEARIAAGEAWALSDEGTLPYLCDHGAWLAAVEARPGDAARLIGAADASRAACSQSQRESNEARAVERAQRMAHLRLGESAFARLREEGRGLPPGEVRRIALRATERDRGYTGLPGVS